MSNIHCLYVEHDATAFERYSIQIATHWNLVTGGTITFDTANSTGDAIARLKNGALHYHLVIVDMLWPPVTDPDAEKQQHVPLGWDVLRVAHTRRDMFVLAMSIGDAHRYPLLAADSLKAGADQFCTVGELFDPHTDRTAFFQQLHESMVHKGVLSDATPIEYDHEDPRIVYIVEEVGRSTLLALYKHATGYGPDLIKLVLGYLAPGMSGALIVKIEAYLKDQPVVHHLLKVTRNRERLKAEVQLCPMDRYAANLIVRYLDRQEDGVSSVGSWHASVAPFESYTITLRQWLCRGPSSSDVTKLCEALFLKNGLTRGYTPNVQTSHANTVAAMMPTVSRCARIYEALSDLSDLIVAADYGNLAAWPANKELLLTFLRKVELAGVENAAIPKSPYMCYCHGDLHSRNVLVSTAAQSIPLLIDWSDYGVRHWATDIARLIVDLLLGPYDAGLPSYDWKRIPTWLTTAKHIVERKAVDTSAGPNQATCIAINWLLQELSKISPAVSTAESLVERLWEYQLAVAIEFLRGGYRPDITVTKRVFACAAAGECLRVARDTLKAMPKPGE